MPKTVSTGLKSELGSEASFLCTCWEMTRRDGLTLYFTDHDQDLVISGNTYVAALGYTRSAMSTNVDFSIDNIQLQGIITDDQTLTEDDIRAGLYDFAELKIFLTKWSDVSVGPMKLRRGRLGDISSTASGIFVAQMNGMTQALAHLIGQIYSGLCSADLGDSKCKIDLTLGNGFTFAGSVSGVHDNQNIIITVPGSPSADGWFDNGVLTWTSGNNNGRSIEVKQWTQSTAAAILFLPMPRDIQVGDAFTIYPGCDKRPSTCRDKFNNILNNRSFPFIPGSDAILASPSTLT